MSPRASVVHSTAFRPQLRARANSLYAPQNPSSQSEATSTQSGTKRARSSRPSLSNDSATWRPTSTLSSSDGTPSSQTRRYALSLSSFPPPLTPAR